MRARISHRSTQIPSNACWLTFVGGVVLCAVVISSLDSVLRPALAEERSNAAESPVIRAADTVGVGPSLRGDEAFQALFKLGYRSVLSVDGRPADVQAAEGAGLRVVHVPIGYDAIDDVEASRLSRAWKELPKPVYVHCQHGRIRGPAVAGLFLYWSKPAGRHIDGFLERCGFDDGYQSLKRSIFQNRPEPSAEALASVSEVDGLARSMIALEAAFQSMSRLPNDEAKLLWTQAVAEVDRAGEDFDVWDGEIWKTARTAFENEPFDSAKVATQCAGCHNSLRQ